jgi:tetratricopeptide (TPR) repeat protein
MTEKRTPAQLAEEGQTSYRMRDFTSAAKAFLAAEEGYRAAGNVILTAEMANNLSVTYLQEGKAEQALEAVGETAEFFSQQGDLKRQALALGNRAAALQALNRLDEAIRAYEQSSELLKALGDFELRMYVMQNLSKLYMHKRRPLEALVIYQAGIENYPSKSLKTRILRTLLRVPLKFLKSG